MLLAMLGCQPIEALLVNSKTDVFQPWQGSNCILLPARTSWHAFTPTIAATNSSCTLQLVHSMLMDRSYMRGTRYYTSPYCCLDFVGRLLRSSSDAHLQTTLGLLLASRVRGRLGLGASALDLAMRIFTCAQMGVACEDDRRPLLNLQREDGSWEALVGCTSMGLRG